MTEDEAKTRWCPFARVGFGGHDMSDATPNRLVVGHGLNGADLCIASACMAWRWDEPWTGQTEEGQGGDVVIRLKRKPGEPKIGFCGLAGGPR